MLLLALTFLASCGGLPGPGAAIDVVARRYGNSVAREYEEKISANLSSRDETRNLSVRVVYERNFSSYMLPSYNVLFFGRVSDASIIEKLKSEVPNWLKTSKKSLKFSSSNVFMTD